MAKKQTKKKPAKSFEQTLWDTADKLRGSVESSEYKHVALSLIFLKFISDKFEARKQQLIDEGQGDYVDTRQLIVMKCTRRFSSRLSILRNARFLKLKSRVRGVVYLIHRF